MIAAALACLTVVAVQPVIDIVALTKTETEFVAYNLADGLEVGRWSHEGWPERAWQGVLRFPRSLGIVPPDSAALSAVLHRRGTPRNQGISRASDALAVFTGTTLQLRRSPNSIPEHQLSARQLARKGYRYFKGESIDDRISLSPDGTIVAFSGHTARFIDRNAGLRLTETWLWDPRTVALRRLSDGSPAGWISAANLVMFRSTRTVKEDLYWIVDLQGRRQGKVFSVPWQRYGVGMPIGAGDGYVVFYYQASRDPLRLYRFTPPAKLTRVPFKMAPELRGKALGDFLIRVVKK